MSVVFAFAGEFATFGFVMRFVAIGEYSRYTAGTGIYGFGQYIPAVAEVP